MAVLAPSILAADFSKLGQEVERIDKEGAQYIHIDVMDGMFVPNISFGLPVISSIRQYTKKIFDVHLMIEQPERYIEEFANAGADIITVHAEATKHLDRVIEQIHNCGKKAAVAVNPGTSLSSIEYALYNVDMVLIMSVNPGFGGQSFIPYSIKKVETMRHMADEARRPDLLIEVDGGVTLMNAKELLDAGADVLVAGSAVFKGNVEENVSAFLNIIK